MLNHTRHIWEASDKIVETLGAKDVDHALEILRAQATKQRGVQ